MSPLYENDSLFLSVAPQRRSSGAPITAKNRMKPRRQRDNTGSSMEQDRTTGNHGESAGCPWNHRKPQLKATMNHKETKGTVDDHKWPQKPKKHQVTTGTTELPHGTTANHTEPQKHITYPERSSDAMLPRVMLAFTV